MTDIYKITLSEARHDQANHLQNDQIQLQLQIKELNNLLKLDYAYETGEIEKNGK